VLVPQPARILPARAGSGFSQAMGSPSTPGLLLGVSFVSSLLFP